MCDDGDDDDDGEEDDDFGLHECIVVIDDH
jgi:hypothetical protein